MYKQNPTSNIIRFIKNREAIGKYEQYLWAVGWFIKSSFYWSFMQDIEVSWGWIFEEIGVEEVLGINRKYDKVFETDNEYRWTDD